MNFQSIIDQGSDSARRAADREHVFCNGAGNQVAIRLFGTNDGAVGDVLEFGINGTGLSTGRTPGARRCPRRTPPAPGP